MNEGLTGLEWHGWTNPLNAMIFMDLLYDLYMNFLMS